MILRINTQNLLTESSFFQRRVRPRPLKDGFRAHIPFLLGSASLSPFYQYLLFEERKGGSGGHFKRCCRKWNFCIANQSCFLEGALLIQILHKYWQLSGFHAPCSWASLGSQALCTCTHTPFCAFSPYFSLFCCMCGQWAMACGSGESSTWQWIRSDHIVKVS